MCSVKVGQIEHFRAALVGPANERLELLLSHPGVIGLTIAAGHSCPKAETGQLEIGSAKRHRAVGIDLLGGFRESKLAPEQNSAHASNRPFQEFSTFHSMARINIRFGPANVRASARPAWGKVERTR